MEYRIPVTNTGKLAGKETVELYVGETEVSPENPVKELKGFCKLSLAPGETKYAEFELTADAFRHFDDKTVYIHLRSPIFFYCFYVQLSTVFIIDYSAIALNASSRSSIISSMFSVPMDRRIVFGLIP